MYTKSTHTCSIPNVDTIHIFFTVQRKSVLNNTTFGLQK